MSASAVHRIHLAEVASTNGYARGLATDGGAVLVTADYQTAGRGQRGNSWESASGVNLLFSLVITPVGVSASQQFVLCELISVALCEVLSRYVPDVRIKWPNDIYYRDQKLCGILIEHDLEGVHLSRTIIGVGLNVNQVHFMGDAPNPVSLFQILGHEVEREVLLRVVVDHFMELYAQYSAACPTLCRDALHERYSRLLYRRGVEAMFRDADGDFVATLRGVADDGCLLLDDASGKQRSYLFKEVAYVL